MTTSDIASRGPHHAIPVTNDRDRFCAELFDNLWRRYRQRVSHVQSYERVIAAAGATFVNDHIAFRTFACQQPMTGIASVSRLFEALGYRAAGNYQFEDKFLNAIHFQHPNHQFPKLFVSELQTWALPSAAQEIILRTVKSHRAPISDVVLSELHQMNGSTERRSQLLDLCTAAIHDLPWEVPQQSDVTALNKVSQYAAWVLVHGYNVNHFTALINSHQVSELDDLEKTIDSLRAAGVPMKSEIEGERGSKLRQTATEAAILDVEVVHYEKRTTMPWTYAYFELAERGEITDSQTGQRLRFEGFLGPQATNLFNMTALKQ